MESSLDENSPAENSFDDPERSFCGWTETFETACNGTLFVLGRVESETVSPSDDICSKRPSGEAGLAEFRGERPALTASE